MKPIESVLDLLVNVQGAGPKWTAQCPAHEDRRNSLSITSGEDGRILFHCHAGCSIGDILTNLGLVISDLLPSTVKGKSGMDIEREYNYTDASGKLLYQVVRIRPKDFRLRRPVGGGKWDWSIGDTGWVLYHLPEVNAAVASGARIFIVEGEKDADNIRKLSLTATTNAGGAGKWRDEYTEALQGANVVILPDNDDAGRKHGAKVAGALHGVAASVRLIELPNLPDKGDVSDWLEAGGSAEQLNLLADAVPDYQPSERRQGRSLTDMTPGKRSRHGGRDGEEPSTAQALVQLAQGQTERFSSLEDGTPFARFEVTRNGEQKSHWETWPIRSRAFRDWLSRHFYQETERVPNAQAMEEALRILEADARYEGKVYPLSVRVAHSDTPPGSVWIDLADADWRAICVTSEGWEIVDDPPILFRRFPVANSHATPERGGSIELLRPFLNLRDNSAWVQLVAWLVAGFLPEIPHPVLMIHGEQGTAKSTLMRLISSLLDPTKTPLRTAPDNGREWVQAVSHSWLSCIDNVSRLPDWLSDAICRAVTGDAFSKRQLYSDDEDIIVSFRRVIAMTSIDIVANRANLLDRSILLPLEPITPSKRRLESEVLSDFEKVRPLILGGVLDILSRVLAILPTIRLESLPRMADFARVGTAVEQVMGWQAGTFVAAYAANVSEQNAEALSASLPAEAIRELMEQRETWAGTTGELLAELNQILGDKGRQTNWPKTPRALAGELRRVAPNLRAVGIGTEWTRTNKSRQVRLFRGAKSSENESSQSSLWSLPAQTEVTDDDSETALSSPRQQSSPILYLQNDDGDDGDGGIPACSMEADPYYEAEDTEDD